jgi:hypothetical protein
VEIDERTTHFLHPFLMEMENDDLPIGQILSRREALKLLGLGSAAFLAACASPEVTGTVVPTAEATQVSSAASTVLDCVVRPEMTIGPYFVDDQLNRSDIRTEPSDNSVKAGVPLTLRINVASVGNNSCNPIAGAQWERLSVYIAALLRRCADRPGPHPGALCQQRSARYTQLVG